MQDEALGERPQTGAHRLGAWALVRHYSTGEFRKTYARPAPEP